MEFIADALIGFVGRFLQVFVDWILVVCCCKFCIAATLYKILIFY